jgi:hypothetical protein
MVIAVQQLSALLMLLLGLSFLLNLPLWYRYTRNVLEAPWQAIPLALVLLVVGLLIVIYHNLWLANWVIIITLTGWLFIIKALIFLLLPGTAALFGRLSEQALKTAIVIAGVTMTAVGALVSYTLYFS